MWRQAFLTGFFYKSGTRRWSQQKRCIFSRLAAGCPTTLHLKRMDGIHLQIHARASNELRTVVLRMTDSKVIPRNCHSVLDFQDVAIEVHLWSFFFILRLWQEGEQARRNHMERDVPGGSRANSSSMVDASAGISMSNGRSPFGSASLASNQRLSPLLLSFA